MMKSRSQENEQKEHVEITDHHGEEAIRYGIRTPFSKERLLLLCSQLQ